MKLYMASINFKTIFFYYFLWIDVTFVIDIILLLFLLYVRNLRQQ
jgi:hypothetical protein